jgi:hypothetical protein
MVEKDPRKKKNIRNKEYNERKKGESMVEEAAKKKEKVEEIRSKK